MSGFASILRESLLTMARRPLYWYGMIILPMLLFLFLTEEMKEGLPQRVPAAIVDMDHTSLSRRMTATLDAMQLVSIDEAAESYTEAVDLMREGRIFGFFIIPENFEADLLAGRSPAISFYTNMTYFVPGTLLYKNFKAVAVYTKAGIVLDLLENSTGATANEITPMINPVSVVSHPVGNPWLNYAYYLCNSFVPGVLQLMIMLMTAYTVCAQIKRGTSRRLLEISGGSIVRGITALLLPQTIVWIVIAMFMTGWLFGWNAYPMNGSVWILVINSLCLVIASQAFSLFICCALPNMRFALSVNALLGILTFSIAAFSFPIESMYPAIGIFSWILPVRYYFLIYITDTLDGFPLYYIRYYLLAYMIFLLAPLTLLWHLKSRYRNPVYIP